MEDLIARLDAIDRKLDYVVERQRFVEDLMVEMTPVAREAVNAMAVRMADWEKRGWFAMGNELVALFDKLAQAYGPDDIQQLSEHVVQIVDTIRNVTQPDVLDLANDATDVIHNAGTLEPVGMFKAVKATSEDDVQRGLAVALEILRHLGRAQGGATGERRAPPARATAPAAPARTEAEVPAAPAPPKAPTLAPVPPPAAPETVVWEGATFTSEGFLVDPAQWTPELAAKMAAGLGITLTDAHWVVLNWARQDYAAGGASPNVRRIATGSGVGTRKMYELFPNTPGKTAAMIAGLPKPVGCV